MGRKLNITIILSIAIVSLAFFAESIFGFGGGLISIPLLSLLLGVKATVTLILIFQFLMGILIIKTYKDTDWKIALPMTAGLIIGTIVGTYILSVMDSFLLRKLLAISIFVFLVKMIFFQGFNFGKHKQGYGGFFAGALGGLFQGMIGTGGPIFTMYLVVAQPVKVAFRATLIYLFFATSVICIFTSLSIGLITQKTLSSALLIIPFFLLAIFLGNHIHYKVDEKYYRRAVQFILFFAAASILLTK